MGMDIFQATNKHLRATAALTSLVGTRIYPQVLPQGSQLPAVAYSLVSEIPVRANKSDPKLSAYRLQISVFSTSYAQCRAVAKQTKAALRDYRTAVSGLFGDGTSGVDVQRVFFENEVDLFSVDPGTVDTIPHIAQDFLMWAST